MENNISILSIDNITTKLYHNEQNSIFNLPDFDEICRYKCKQIIKIPQSLEYQWNTILCDIFYRISTDNDEIAWKLFFMVSKCIWTCHTRAGKKNRGRRRRLWERRMNDWVAGKYIDLWNEYKIQCEINKNDKDKNNKNNKDKYVRHKLKPGEDGYDDQLLKQRIKSAKFYARNGDLSGGIRAVQSFGVLDE